MDAIDKFTNRENIARFSSHYEIERDPGARESLRKLLLIEENKYGFYSEQLQLAARHISECNVRIARQKAIVEEIRARGGSVLQAEAVLENLTTLRDLFMQFHDRAASGLKTVRL